MAYASIRADFTGNHKTIAGAGEGVVWTTYRLGACRSRRQLLAAHATHDARGQSALASKVDVSKDEVV
jgi:hypothetical protein